MTSNSEQLADYRKMLTTLENAITDNDELQIQRETLRTDLSAAISRCTEIEMLDAKIAALEEKQVAHQTKEPNSLAQ
jgi:regulator of replication initiation timing